MRKKHVVSRLHDALAWQALPVVQLLAPDERVCGHLIGTLFGKSAAVAWDSSREKAATLAFNECINVKLLHILNT